MKKTWSTVFCPVFPGLTILNRKIFQILTYTWIRSQPSWKNSWLPPSATGMTRFWPRPWLIITPKISFFPRRKRSVIPKSMYLCWSLFTISRISCLSMTYRLYSHRLCRNISSLWQKRIWPIYIMKFSAWRRIRSNLWKRICSANIKQHRGLSKMQMKKTRKFSNAFPLSVF